MNFSRALETALGAAAAAGALLREDFHRASGARGAGDKAEADVEAEALIRARLLEAFPRWGYLGEETGRVDVQPWAPVWVVDPNDGTRDYLRGWRGSAVSIALVWEGRPVLGVVYAFAYPDDAGDLFAWAEGCGPLRRNGRALEARLPETLSADVEVLVSSQGDRDTEANLRCCAPARYRTLPSIAHRLALVAAGEAAAATSLKSPVAWDYAAGHALLRAAGAVLLDQHGQDVGYAVDGMSRAELAFAAARPVATALARRPWSTVAERGAADDAWPVRLRRGEALSDGRLLARAQGCLFGQVAGDNLGALVETARADWVRERYPDGPSRLEDGGVWGILAGQATDDSEMALALARSIVERDAYVPDTALAAYRHWLASEPFDVGTTVRSALLGVPLGDSQANGSLMRVSPLAVFAHALPPARVAELARADAALTHPHPVCGDATAAFAVAVAHAVARGDGPDAAHRAALAWAREAAAETSVIRALTQAPVSAPVCDEGPMGWVLIALQNAFHELLNARSLERGVVATVRRGGDADTNAAIAGALLGAVHGRAAVPAQWRRRVLSCRPHPLCCRQSRPREYWPIDVLDVAERLVLAGRRAAG